MKSEAVKAFIFDLDYTLIDSSEGIVYCFNQARKRAGEPELPADRIKARIGIPIEQTFELYGSKDPLAMRDEFRRLSRQGAMANRSFLLPGIRSTIPALAARGFRLAVASTKSYAEIKTILEKLKLSSYFEEIAGSDDVESAKPAPDSLLLLLERMRLDPDQAVYVGDHVVDIQAARAAGMPVIAVRGGPVSEQELKREDPDTILDNVSAIPEFIAKIR